MSFRRFVYLVTDNASRRDFLLRRIDMSRFFLPKSERDRLLTDPPPLEEAELPRPAMRFIPPFSEYCKGSLDFMLLAGSSREHGDDKVVATDQTGRTLLYDAESDSVRTLCSLTAPKREPVSFTVGDNLYVLDRLFTPGCNRGHCFDGLIYDDGGRAINMHHDWYCRSLPPPPYADTHDPAIEGDPAHFSSHALVGGSNIWISKRSLGTHSFNVESGLWTKVGAWAMPFDGHAEYVQELNLWFGLTCGYGEGSSICASDLAVAPHMATGVVWREFTPPGWISRSSHLVHLGRSRFCHARFFKTWQPDVGHLDFVVFTGIEVERRARGGGKLFVLKHRSERCSLHHRLRQWVL